MMPRNGNTRPHHHHRAPVALRTLSVRAAIAALCLVAGAVAARAATSVAAAAPDPQAAAQLHRLLEESDAAMLERNPLVGLYRGDLRYAGRYGDHLSNAYVAAERHAAAADLARLAAIPRERLGAIDQVAYDTFGWARQEALAQHSAAAAAIWTRLPLDHFGGAHLAFATLSSGEGSAPYRSVAEYEDGLSRIDGFVTYLDRAVARMREGIATGIVLPRFVVDHLARQFGDYATQAPAQSPYYGPVRRWPDAIAAPDRERLAIAYEACIEQRLRPALRRMHAFLVDEYRAAARDSDGWSALPGGAADYQRLIRSYTTVDIGARAAHRLGLAEVARITAAMREVQRRVGFRGTLAEFHAHVRTDAAFRPQSAERYGDGFRAIGRRVDAALDRLFESRPATPLEIRPTPDEEAPTAAGASYQSGSPDTGKPGIFYFNTHDLPSRNVNGMETLYLHEAVPGHHFESMLAHENTALPKLLRYDGNSAYSEGWALYAESLGPELGLFVDPYQLLGRYDDEMLRAMRLVVDTGLHAGGWSRERAVAYLLANSAISRTDAVAEIERYVVWPGQALAYKVGELTIQRLRQRAARAFGARFDLRAFHTRVLSTGNVPLAVLEAGIDAWIASKEEGAPSGPRQPSRR
jgi:uncharacterized protein (DUF885 family)